jgi:hypothetical protein
MKRDEFDPNRYYLSSERRHALWENEVAMLIVLALPVVVASFWYGSTIEVVGLTGQVISPALTSRGVGLAIFTTLALIIGAALYLYVQPSAERVAHAQPVRGSRRLSFAGFDGLLVGLITYQSLPAGALSSGFIAVAVGVSAAVIAYVAMRSMVDIPPAHERARSSYPPGQWFTY